MGSDDEVNELCHEYRGNHSEKKGVTRMLKTPGGVRIARTPPGTQSTEIISRDEF
jgi:hypothetical protein